MHLIWCDATASYETNTHFRRCYPSDHDKYNVLDEFKSLDEFNSIHTSHNRRI